MNLALSDMLVLGKEVCLFYKSVKYFTFKILGYPWPRGCQLPPAGTSFVSSCVIQLTKRKCSFFLFFPPLVYMLHEFHFNMLF